MNIGVLLINTGTPKEPTVEAIRPYLTEFLMDPYIISAPYLVRKCLVSHIVKNRPKRTVAHYQSFWTPEGSPFLLTSYKQQKLLQEKLESLSSDNTYHVELGMRYGEPNIQQALEKLYDLKCETLIIFPLYPQNVKVCAGTCFKEAYKQLSSPQLSGWNPKVFEITHFHHEEFYRLALAHQVAKHWEYKPGSKLIVSFHSTLLRDIKKDPTYLAQCKQTKEWLAQDLNIPASDVILSFQSRFDSRKWLSPFTEHVLEELLAQNVKDICIVCPGFVADNIETMVEINQQLRAKTETKLMPGHIGDNRLQIIDEVSHKVAFTYVPALEDSPELIEALVQAIQKTVQGI